MKTHEYVYYIKTDKWDDFMQNYNKLGYNREGGFAYPDYVYKKLDDKKIIKINISEPCINMWDNEDKNRQREIWLCEGNLGYGKKEVLFPYISDLIDGEYV